MARKTRTSGLTVGKTRGFLYQLARLLGDISALFKGPGAVAKRAGRRAAGRAMGKMFK